jgi:hypothetical protein
MNQIFNCIDEIIEGISNFKSEPLFSQELNRRISNIVVQNLDDQEILKAFAYLIAYSQNSNSELVERLINNGSLDGAFEEFTIDKVAKLNPCDIADEHWDSLKGMRQQAKLFHIVSLARKIKKMGSIRRLIAKCQFPPQIKSENEIEIFWNSFNHLQSEFKKNKISFFQSTTSLLHFLLETGHDCIKPDLVVLRVARKLNIIDNENSDENLRKVAKTVQLYSVSRKIRPPAVDLFFLINEGQRGARKFVLESYYNLNNRR